jgi:hypothetical protein
MWKQNFYNAAKYKWQYIAGKYLGKQMLHQKQK